MLQSFQNTVCKILLISSDLTLIKTINEHLNNPVLNLQSSVLSNFEGLNSFLEFKAIDLLILDLDVINCPNREIVQIISSNPKLYNVPKILLTTKEDSQLKIYAFENGIEDYIIKPFLIHEFVAKIKNIFKKYKKFHGDQMITVSNITLNPVNHMVKINGQKIKMSSKEATLFRLFLENPTRIFSREEILHYVWIDCSSINLRTVDVHINRLRIAVGLNSFGKSYIKTVRGAGYGLEIENQECEMRDFKKDRYKIDLKMYDYV